ncbi:MAG: hypothetical protein RL134_2218 [Actinomycetota bacterium]|jgi:hypothetical protein
MKATSLAVACSVVFLAACGGGGGGEASDASATPTRCYELIEGSSRAVAKIEANPTSNDPEGGQITIYSYVDGVEEFAPETTPGRLESDAFVYGDGTRLILTADTLTWPQDSLLEGAVFTSSACP